MPCTSVRLIVLLALGILLAPLSSDAQGPAQVRRIGVLAGGSPDPERLRNLEAFRHSLRDLGWVEGQNLAMEVRWAEGRPERVPELAAELVRLQVEVMVAGGGVSRPAQDATRTIPIVMVALGGDPVAQGFVASLGRPGGNITGTTAQQVDLSGKRLKLLKALVPEVSRIAFLVTPAHRAGAPLQETQRAAQALGVELQVLEVSSPDEFESAFSAMHAAGAGALLLPTSALVFERHHRDITALALQSRLPTMYPWRMYPEAGGLMSYGEKGKRGQIYFSECEHRPKPHILHPYPAQRLCVTTRGRGPVRSCRTPGSVRAGEKVSGTVSRPVASTGQQATARGPGACGWLMLVWPQRRPLGQWGAENWAQSLHP